MPPLVGTEILFTELASNHFSSQSRQTFQTAGFSLWGSRLLSHYKKGTRLRQIVLFSTNNSKKIMIYACIYQYWFFVPIPFKIVCDFECVCCNFQTYLIFGHRSYSQGWKNAIIRMHSKLYVIFQWTRLYNIQSTRRWKADNRNLDRSIGVLELYRKPTAVTAATSAASASDCKSPSLEKQKSSFIFDDFWFVFSLLLGKKCM